jgi:nucleoside-diphosphate-sugar epimerase
VLDFAKLIKKLAGSDVEIIHKPLPTDDPKSRRPDLTRARSILKWEPQVSLEDGLRRTIEFFRKHISRVHAATE